MGASFVDPYLAARQTDTPIIELEEYGITIDFRELASLTIMAETEEITEYDESDVERSTSVFWYDPELKVIMLDVTHDTPDLVDFEEMLSLEEAVKEIRERMKPMRNTTKTLVARHTDGTEEHLEGRIERQQVSQQDAVKSMLSAFRAQAGEISPERMTELTEDKLLIPAIEGDVDSSVTLVNFTNGEHAKPEEAAKMMQENPELAISSVVVRLVDEKVYSQRSDRGLVAVDRLNAEEFAALCAHTDAEYVQQSFGYKRIMMHVRKRAETEQAAVDSLVKMLSDPEQLPGVLDHCFARDELEEIDQQFRNAADFDAWEAIARKALDPAGYSIRVPELKSNPYFENGFPTVLHVQYESDQVVLSVQEQSVSLSIRAVADAIAKAAHDYMTEEEPVLTTRDILDAEVLRGTGFVGGKERVQAFYETENPDGKQLAAFLKKEYGTGGHTGNGQHFMTDYDAGGMWIRMRNGESTKFNWNQVAEVALTRLAANTYLTPEEQQERQMLRVYQLKQGEQYHGIRYMSLSDNADKGLNQDDYDLVYECRWGDIPCKTDHEKLERLYTILNTERPEDYTGRSLSMSDVLTVGDTAYYVDTVGFQEMPEFFAEKKVDTYITNEEPFTEGDQLALFDAAQPAPEPVKVDTYINPPEPEKKHQTTRAERLYKQFCEQYPAIADGSHTYERYGSHDDNSGWEPLSIEYLGENQYGFMTTYIQNGDLMRDPDFVIELDHENKTLHVLEYQQDGVPPVGTVYERVYDEFGNPDRKLQAALEENFMVNLRNAAAANRALHVFEDAEGRHELVPDESEQEPVQQPDDPNPELRAVLNAFSEKHGLGALQVTPGRYGSELGEIMQDGAVHPLGTLFSNDNGKPFTPDTLQKALDSFEQNRTARGEEISDAMGRHQMLEKHGGAAPLPEVQKDLPEIFYADSPSMRISNNLSAIREMLRLEQTILFRLISFSVISPNSTTRSLTGCS